MIQGNRTPSRSSLRPIDPHLPHCASFHADQYQQIKRKLHRHWLDRVHHHLKFIFDAPVTGRLWWHVVVVRCVFFISASLLYENRKKQDWARGEIGEEIITSLRNIGKVRLDFV
jgi:hypothetical protein